MAPSREVAIHPVAAGKMLQTLERERARIGAQAIYTLDGSRNTVEVVVAGKSQKVVRCGWASVRHDGVVVSGGADGGFDNYLAELAAQVDTAQRDAGVTRAVVVVDASSPVEALLKFQWLNFRKRQRRLANHALDTWRQALGAFEAVTIVWQTSHVDEPVNDWGDVEADAAVSDAHLHRLPDYATSFSFASGEIVGPRQGVRAWAERCVWPEVEGRLRAVTCAQTWQEGDLRLVGLTAELDEVAAEVLCGRVQVGDEGVLWDGAAARYSDIRLCPFGCGCAFTWWHAQFVCKGSTTLCELREAWRVEVHGLLIELEGAACDVPNDNLNCALCTLGGISGRAGTGAAFTTRDEKELRLRRVVGGCIRGSGAGDSEAGRRARARRCVEAGLRIQLAAREATAERLEELREEGKRCRLARPWACRWMRAVGRAAPARAACLAELARARRVAEGVVARRATQVGRGATEIAELEARVEVAFSVAWAETREDAGLVAVSMRQALKEWRWLSLLLKWRARARRRVIAGGGAASVVTPWSSAAKGILSAAEGAAGGEAREGRISLYASRGAGGARGMWSAAESARGWFRRAGGRSLEGRLRGEDVQAGFEAAARVPRHAVDEVKDVRHPAGGKGRQLEVLVSWKGVDPRSRRPWDDEWVSVTRLTDDLKDVARAMELVLKDDQDAPPQSKRRRLGRAVLARHPHGVRGGENNVGAVAS